jgi:hypothetical protein
MLDHILKKIVSLVNSHLIDYPTPAVSYFSSFGSLSGICLIIQSLYTFLLCTIFNSKTLQTNNIFLNTTTKLSFITKVNKFIKK